MAKGMGRVTVKGRVRDMVKVMVRVMAEGMGVDTETLRDQLARGPHAAFYDAFIATGDGGGSVVDESCSWRVLSAGDNRWGPKAGGR
ncbi:uncharacterized protein A4U43_C05F24110 [Asparagus officinalis]|uniref:Uncharacterized protein n=1 Tax=Asparagus officinalis TaxID=4686 RepID=A0A5P1EU88_ASPOF|nr:uncharacterized protein A4U43_C05F24110 [Asparagus officinalis]